jgi:hypothetical protein
MKRKKGKSITKILTLSHNKSKFSNPPKKEEESILIVQIFLLNIFKYKSDLELQPIYGQHFLPHWLQ